MGILTTFFDCLLIFIFIDDRKKSSLTKLLLIVKKKKKCCKRRIIKSWDFFTNSRVFTDKNFVSNAVKDIYRLYMVIVFFRTCNESYFLLQKIKYKDACIHDSSDDSLMTI